MSYQFHACLEHTVISLLFGAMSCEPQYTLETQWNTFITGELTLPWLHLDCLSCQN